MTKPKFMILSLFALAVISALGLLAVAGCGGRVFPSASPPPATTRVFEVRGTLVSLDPAHSQATIAHEAIPGYMAAMTMAYRVLDNTEVRDLKPGDKISFRLNVTATDAWIDHVQKIDADKNAGADAAPLFTPAQIASRELKEGDPMPDIALVDDQGAKIRLSDFRGNAVAFTFIYTRCPLPTYCPLMERNFHATQDLLGRLGAGDNWRMLSITLDPAFDTPRVLDGEAKTYGATPSHWIFATGSEADVRRFGGAVGLEYGTVDGQITHNLRTVVIDAAGRIHHIFRGNTWTPQELASEMRSALKTAR